MVMRTGEALLVGAGNIGLGFLGQVMSEAGLQITLADVNQQRVAALNREGAYPIELVSLEGTRQQYVEGVKAISSLDEAAMIEATVKADIITTAVGADNLAKVAPTLAKGLVERLTRRPADEMHLLVVACENVDSNTQILMDHILAALPDDEWRRRVEGQVSSPNCVVDRIVPNTKSGIDHPLAVTAEDYYQLAVDGPAIKHDIPNIPGMEIVDNLEAKSLQKLFTLNGPHAAAGWLAYLKGYETVHEAMGDPNISSLVRGLMHEVGAVIVSHYPSINAEQQQAFADNTFRRFLNPYLKDQPSRVGRDPKRKLNARDRLLRPAILANDDGQTTDNINMAIIGGFRFNNPADPQAVAVHHEIDTAGLDAAVVAITGLQKTHPIVRHTVAGYQLTELMV